MLNCLAWQQWVIVQQSVNTSSSMSFLLVSALYMRRLLWFYNPFSQYCIWFYEWNRGAWASIAHWCHWFIKSDGKWRSEGCLVPSSKECLWRKKLMWRRSCSISLCLMVQKTFRRIVGSLLFSTPRSLFANEQSSLFLVKTFKEVSLELLKMWSSIVSFYFVLYFIFPFATIIVKCFL